MSDSQDYYEEDHENGNNSDPAGWTQVGLGIAAFSVAMIAVIASSGGVDSLIFNDVVSITSDNVFTLPLVLLMIALILSSFFTVIQALSYVDNSVSFISDLAMKISLTVSVMCLFFGVAFWVMWLLM